MAKKQKNDSAAQTSTTQVQRPNLMEGITVSENAKKTLEEKQPTEIASTLPQKTLPTFDEYKERRRDAELEYSKTWQGMMDANRKKLQQEKTDAEKMKRYHALSDAFKAIGKIGGVAAGGAIGGNMLDSAPATGEYKPSRGYLEAFENAKQANEKLKELDNLQFKLAYDRDKTAEEYAYKWRQSANETAQRRDEQATEREFQTQLAILKAQLQEAIAQGKDARAAELRLAIAEVNGQYELKKKSIETNAKNRRQKTKITVNGRDYEIDTSDPVVVSQIYNMIPADANGERPYGQEHYWDGEFLYRDNPTKNEMLAAIGQNLDNEDFIAAFENRFGSGSNNGIDRNNPHNNYQ